jgi:hypothetical protein
MSHDAEVAIPREGDFSDSIFQVGDWLYCLGIEHSRYTKSMR